MPNNIFGTVGGEGLENPLTATLDAGGYNITNLDTLFVGGIESNSGGAIQIKNELDMNSLRIIDLPDPLAAQEPVTLAYGEANFASAAVVPTTAPYDVFGAFTDETTVIPAGIPVFTLPIPRGFTCSGARAFLTTGATSNNYFIVDIRLNGTVIPQSFGQLCEFAIAGETTSSLGSFTAGNIFLSVGDKITCSVNNDATAAGLKIVLYGTTPI